MQRAGLYGTQEAFTTECQALNIPIQHISSSEQQANSNGGTTLVSENTIHVLLNAFDNAYQDAFFEVRQYFIYPQFDYQGMLYYCHQHIIIVYFKWFLFLYSIGMTKMRYRIFTMMLQRDTQK